MIVHLVTVLALGLGVPDSTDVVVYEDNVLEQAVVVAGRGRMDRLCARGGRVPMTVMAFTGSEYVGHEVGAVVKAKGDFALKYVSLPVAENRMEDCVVSVRVYAGDGFGDVVPGTSVRALVPVFQKGKRVLRFAVEPGVVLPRGEYLVTFTLESAAPSDVTEGKGMYFTAFAGRRMERGSAGEEFVEKGMNPGIFLEGEKL